MLPGLFRKPHRVSEDVVSEQQAQTMVENFQNQGYVKELADAFWQGLRSQRSLPAFHLCCMRPGNLFHRHSSFESDRCEAGRGTEGD